MVGAILGAVSYRLTGKVWMAFPGEILGTGVIGGMLCYPVASLLMGNKEAALFTYVFPFMVSTLGGCLLAAMVLGMLNKSGTIQYLQGMLKET